MQRSGAGWSGVIRGPVGSEFDIVVGFFLNVADRIDNDKQADYHYERENDCESLAHRGSVSGLQRFTIARAKVLPVVGGCLDEAVPVAFKSFRESFQR